MMLKSKKKSKSRRSFSLIQLSLIHGVCFLSLLLLNVLCSFNSYTIMQTCSEVRFLSFWLPCRAEEYFQRAARAQPPDAEALSRYANFLWLARKDITAAEETYLEAIAADPGNILYAGNYAHFLWNTGGEDTCYPLDQA